MPLDAPLSVIMKKTRLKRWSAVLLYTLAGAAFLGVPVFVTDVLFPTAPPVSILRSDDPSTRTASNSGRENRQQEDKILILLNHEKIIGKAKLVYRGLAANSKFKIDVAILDLDPHAYYSYRLSIAEARKGFRLAGSQFKLISVRKSAIQIRHLKKPGS